ncbi:DUF2975 domain containing protein [Sulfitobacter noctilucicola]|uniref:DUF2975 domain-containing protein n=1 Tax=Sulfitobacter noctilucicola TaxID=1342301 RepID=A0A7W6Q3J1_9RHOB|nr:DUF2975 domain-containing protein [Sulfitobacter noctilucicola]KIN64570.1 DUF2975 domain containing protein [Sulfitobacter noctilucicola]MBB4174275.1 hypothetical protein [Sulfitobacter noctilucicola]
MHRIRNLSTLAMIILVPMLVYYPYEALSWNLELSFLDWGKWTRNDNWVHPDAEIALPTRIVFFTVWLIPTVLGWLAYATGFSILWLLRNGTVFDVRIATRLKWMGGLIFGSSTAALVAGAVSPMVRSWHNPDGPLPLRFWYESTNIGMTFCGLGFLFLGIVMHEAIRIARENEEFV